MAENGVKVGVDITANVAVIRAVLAERGGRGLRVGVRWAVCRIYC